MPQVFSRLSLSVLGALLVVGCSKPAQAPEPERAVRTLVLASDSAGGTREYAAEIRARTESRLSFRVGGKLLQRRVNLGDVVKPGQVLAQLDAQDLVLAQEAAKAAVLAARVNRDQLGADYRRFIELKDQGFISAAELERRDSAFKAAQAQLEQARAQAGVQTNQAAYAMLVADTAGVITGVDAEPGMVVGPGTPIVRIAHDGPRDVVFSVPEDQVSLLRAATAVPGAFKVRLWGEGQQPRDISLRELAAAADPVTRTFQAKADVGKLDVKLGQTATVLLQSAVRSQVLKLPLSAVLEQQGHATVWLLDAASMTVKSRQVQVAGADGNEVVVADGLKPGDEVVIAGVHVLTAGQKVRRYQAPAEASPAAARAASR
ncbi:efflux RND transporter periplasmic adaptor subunit [Paucibacter sediminis]|uniref:Efflux RND transporter periplasmic adaptor subunit n=1 Tax=Paucibacter sediminis TaxID=3019553 RepID=A0AA95ND08_9BURK|nr:efflux RND transporter periplasmic adaptor subunit [Paucibacter sp. S2-9]WIT11859.1 efflux RND transporter periplasmic adaptor subunit [Paucibacter sp. S2-9]